MVKNFTYRSEEEEEVNIYSLTRREVNDAHIIDI